MLSHAGSIPFKTHLQNLVLRVFRKVPEITTMSFKFFFLNQVFYLVALFQVRTQSGMQRGCSPASPKDQDIHKPKGDREDVAENKKRRWKEETDTRILINMVKNIRNNHIIMYYMNKRKKKNQEHSSRFYTCHFIISQPNIFSAEWS